ncbi:head maturation protease, ClpP-related [Clostridium sp. BJN0013]|uniref:head maturation protease, ClpP-related n=1 Tax=Clostridium sp. BJN0013 TaxID=3236840 RepID=UPI0034C619CE
MAKILEFKSKDKSGKEKVNGKMEIKNQTESSSELYFYGDICGSTWDKWQDEDKCPQDVTDFLNQLEGNKDVNIYINSGGGDAFAGLAIYNTLKRNPANKTVHVDGVAASAASVIALAGDKVIIPKTAQFMIHKAWGICIGNANDMRKYADDLDKCDESILNVYMENVKEGVKADTIKQMVDDSTWMTGEDAAKYFNVEVGEGLTIAAYADSQFFSMYKNLPECLKDKVQKSKAKDSNNAKVQQELKQLIREQILQIQKESKTPKEPKQQQTNAEKLMEIFKKKMEDDNNDNEE